MLDRMNQEIKVGSIIAYGHALGRCAGLRIGKVTKIREEEVKNDWGRGKHWEYGIQVMGVDDDWDDEKPKLCVKKGTLMYPDRTIVLDESKVPEKYLNLLKDVK